MITILIALVVGYVMGLIHKGIHIHVDKAEKPKQEGYNQSMAGMLPPEIQNYYQETQGFNKF